MKKIYSFSFLFILIGYVSFYNKGYSQWTSNTSLNTPICVATGAQRDPRIESDGNGGAFIMWKDYRVGVPDVYVQRVDSNGVPLWIINGVGACIQAADQSTPSLISDGADGIIVTWSDWRSGIERDIYAQRIDGNGNLLWAMDGAIVTNKPEREHNERIISDGVGGCIIAWEEQKSSPWRWEIWAQRLNSNGVIQWPAGGIPVVTAISNKRNPKLQKDHSGGAYITWQDLRDGLQYDIYAQHLSSDGTRLWGTDGLAVCSAPNTQNNPKIDPDILSGGVYIAWADQRSGTDNDIYCQRIDSLGNPLWISNGVAVCNAINGQTAVDLLSNSNVTGLILTWKDERAGNTDIYAQRLDIDGVSQWAANGIAVETGSFPQINPNISGDGMGGAVICWQDSTATSVWDIKAQRIDSSGTKLWNANGAIVSDAIGQQIGPKNTSDDYGGTIVVWEDFRTGTRDIYIQHIYWDGGSIGLEEQSNISTLQVYPNPFENHFVLDFTLLKPENISIKIFNLLGKEISEIVSNKILQNAGSHSLNINTTNFAPGIYFLEISGNHYSESIKLVKN